MEPIWLIGMMGSGKSTVGAEVAARLRWTFVDIDAEIAARVGCSIGELWGSAGEEAFRDMESAQVARLADTVDTVISAGGGVVLRGENVRAMRESGVVVWLDAPPGTLADRLEGDSDRPLLRQSDPQIRLSEIAAEREHRYRSSSHFRLDAAATVGEVAANVVGHVRIKVGDASEVLVGRGFAHDLLPVRPDRRKAALLTQAGALTVAGNVGDRLAETGIEMLNIELPDREAAKTLEAVGEVYKRLAEFNLGRYDTIVGVGGGTVTDAAGFVAATWLRGVESVAVPTTLLGAVDAAIGGKTGLNLSGKNLVGAFWHPSRVNVSLDVLETCPRNLMIEGTAEAVKAGFIADQAIVAAYEESGLGAPLAEIVPKAIAVKAKVVSDDFREQGDRAILNFGHTIGHGIETAAGIPHGHAVAIGMVAAATISAARYGFDAPRLTALLTKLELPIKSPAVDRNTVLDLVARDKKRSSDGIRMVLLEDFGRPRLESVKPAELSAGLAAVGLG